MPLAETTMMAHHKEAWHCSWQNRASDLQEMEWRMEVCLTMIKKTVLSTTVAELYSFMKCFGSCQFLRGLWVDMSGEVANLHTRTNAKNLVTTARTGHLPEQKETSHMISVLRRKPVQEVFMILLTFQPKIA